MWTVPPSGHHWWAASDFLSYAVLTADPDIRVYSVGTWPAVGLTVEFGHLISSPTGCACGSCSLPGSWDGSLVVCVSVSQPGPERHHGPCTGDLQHGPASRESQSGRA